MANIYSIAPKGQKARPFWRLLQTVAPDVQCERKFDWLRLPGGAAGSPLAQEICAALIADCGRDDPSRRPGKQACTADELARSLANPPRPSLEVDFYLPSLNIAIEFDERQHFTRERAVTLHCYEGRLATKFDLHDWIARCERIRAQDPDPACRDWQRARRDTMRDLLAAEHGFPLLRIAYDAQPEEKALLTLLVAAKS